MLNFRIQVATLAIQDPDRAAKSLGVATCERQRQIVLETLDWAKLQPFEIQPPTNRATTTESWRSSTELVEIVGDPRRIFEVKACGPPVARWDNMKSRCRAMKAAGAPEPVPMWLWHRNWV